MNILLEVPDTETAIQPEGKRTNPLQRILMVEDDADIRRLNVEALNSSGYAVDAAEDGAAAWEAVQASRYDLLITDNNMPNLTGIGLLKKLRAADMRLPVIMATGTLPTEALFTRYPWLHPAVALVKPYSTDQLLGTVEKVLRTTARPDGEIAPSRDDDFARRFLMPCDPPPNWLKPPQDDEMRL